MLPILPALAASSPVRDGAPSAALDGRLEVYRTNSCRVPSVTGRVIPEPVFSRAGYERDILQRIYRDIAPLDPEGILQHEWLNARGAIARFCRNTIEIRVLDVQECPAADLAIMTLVVALLKALVAERWRPLAWQQRWSAEALEPIFLASVARGDEAVIDDPIYLSAFGIEPADSESGAAPASAPITAGDLWRRLDGQLLPPTDPAAPSWRAPLDVILTQGPLARRILRALAGDFSRPALQRVWSALADCLARGESFRP